MTVLRRTCMVCGLTTRCDSLDPNYVACGHEEGPFEVVNENEDDEAAVPLDQPVE